MYLCFHTVFTTEGVIIPFDLHFAVMVKILSSCICSPVAVQSAMRQDVSHLVAVTDKALSTVLVGSRGSGPIYAPISFFLAGDLFFQSPQNSEKNRQTVNKERLFY